MFRVNSLSIQHWLCRILSTVILVFSVGAQFANSQTQTPTQPKAVSQPSPQASALATPGAQIIAVPQVAAESMRLNQELRSLPESSVSNEALIRLEQRINVLSATTSEKARKSEQTIQAGAIFTELQQSSLDWQALQREVDGLAETLTQDATTLENELRTLKSDQNRWLATSGVVKAQASPPELLDLINRALVDLDAAIKSTEERRSRVVTLQQLLAKESSIVTAQIEQLNKALADSQRSLLVQDSPPLWKVQFVSHDDGSLTGLMRGSYAEGVTRLKAFIVIKRIPLIAITLLTVVAFICFIRLGGAAKTKTGQLNLEQHNWILERPASLALLFFFVAMIPLLYDAPNSVIGVVYLIGMIPVTTLLKPRRTKPLQRMLVVLILSVFSWHLIKLFEFPIWLKRDLSTLFTLAVIALSGWMLFEARRHSNRVSTVTLIAIVVGEIILCLAVLFNVFGYVGLSSLLTQGTFISAYRAVALYTVVVVGVLLISFPLRSETQQEGIVRQDLGRLARQLTFALSLVMLLIWIHTTLGLFAIREGVYAALKAALDYRFTIGSASIAVSNIVAFVLTLLLGYLAASITRAILGEGILPRLKLARGLPNAIATSTHYVLLVLVFLLALSAAGVELSKFTILTGAFGVGLGFGLQNVVNNFVSGLILLFERPVRVGDLLEMKGVSGEVTKIGFRSSTIHALDGSDLIIPNANLISEQVTNWTLKDTRRQIVLNIHVAYGNDPTRVRDLLRSTVAAHPDVLEYPGPKAIFLGFGDSALNFEIYFWVSRPQVALELRSEVALAVASALTEAGIQVPVPRRDLHIIGLNQTNGTDQEIKTETAERSDRTQSAERSL